MNRRNFISSVALAFAPMVFTPKLVLPTWKDTLRFSHPTPFKPRWAFVREEWLMGYTAQELEDHRERGIPLSKMPAIFTSCGIPHWKCNDYNCVFIRNDFYEAMYPPRYTPNGVLIKPFLYMPVEWNPQTAPKPETVLQ